MKKVLTATDIAELLGVCEKTAYGLIRQALTKGDMFKVIKRKHLKLALDIVENYSLTVALNEEVELMNSQVAFA